MVAKRSNTLQPDHLIICDISISGIEETVDCFRKAAGSTDGLLQREFVRLKVADSCRDGELDP